ncbi:hypothetical protein OGATHE_003520 [Ogataea polymorpha]|uniref:Uncharacterized protein n=1 Tax=Ogataea polymorpha TaxID=460523 RepID=A0A9P8P455_9ASCO|nr:hypothetical protein OGATHE_003520 [Ogataea polymorpha]
MRNVRPDAFKVRGHHWSELVEPENVVVPAVVDLVVSLHVSGLVVDLLAIRVLVLDLVDLAWVLRVHKRADDIVDVVLREIVRCPRDGGDVDRVHRHDDIDIFVPRQRESVSDPAQHRAVRHKRAEARLVAEPQPRAADPVDDGLAVFLRVVDAVEEPPVEVRAQMRVIHVRLAQVGLVAAVGLKQVHFPLDVLQKQMVEKRVNNGVGFRLELFLNPLLHGVHDLLVLVNEILLGHLEVGHDFDLVVQLEEIRLVENKLVLAVDGLHGGVVVEQSGQFAHHIIDAHPVFVYPVNGHAAQTSLVADELGANRVDVSGPVARDRHMRDGIAFCQQHDRRLVEPGSDEMHASRRRRRREHVRRSKQDPAGLGELRARAVSDFERKWVPRVLRAFLVAEL